MRIDSIKNASLTVEVTLVLPLFIYAVFFVGYFIQILYIQDTIQHSLDQTANQMASYAYIYDKAELKQTQQEVYQNYQNEQQDFEDTLNEIVTNGQNIYNNTKNVWNVKEDIKKVDVSESIIEEPDNWGNTLEYINQCKEQISNIKENVFTYTQNFINNINNIIEGVASILNNNQMIAGAKKESFEFLIDTAGNKITKYIMLKHINEDQFNRFNIKDGLNGLDLNRSQYMLEDDNIDIVAAYKLNIPIPIKFVEEIPLIQRVTVRAWTGSKPDYRTTNNNSDKNQKVFIANDPNSKVYHTSDQCSYLKIEFKPVLYMNIPKHFKRCSKCFNKKDHVDDFDTVYITISEKGEHYHKYKNCKSVKRYQIHTITKEQAEKEGRCICTRCEKEKK